MKKRIRIAVIEGPIDVSDVAPRYSTPHLYVKLEREYQLTHFCIKRIKSIGSIKNVWIYSIAHTPSLIFSLLKGNFRLFVTGITCPEAIIAFILSKLLRKPVVIIDCHWYWPNSVLSKLFWPIGRFVAKHATLLVGSGQVLKFWEMAKILRKGGNRLRLLPRVSTLKIEEKDVMLSGELRRKLGVERKIVLLYLGRLVKYKGVEYLISAFARISKENRNVVLLVVGEGSERPRLERMCTILRLNDVYFTGPVNDREKVAYFLLCDLFVHPAFTMETPEEWGFSVNEAMSVGKPVIVTSAVGARELVNHGTNGYVVPEKDVDALYNAIKVIISDNGLRNEMGYAAKRTIEQGYTYSHYVEHFSRVIEEALKTFHTWPPVDELVNKMECMHACMH